MVGDELRHRLARTLGDLAVETRDKQVTGKTLEAVSEPGGSKKS